MSQNSDEQMSDEQVYHNQTALPSQYLLIFLLSLTNTEANPNNNLMMRLGVVAASRFHKEIVLVQTAIQQWNLLMVLSRRFITKSKLSGDLSV